MQEYAGVCPRYNADEEVPHAWMPVQTVMTRKTNSALSRKMLGSPDGSVPVLEVCRACQGVRVYVYRPAADVGEGINAADV
jgi:hypothetical protein